MAKKDDVVTGLTGGIEGCLKRTRWIGCRDAGEIIAPGKVAVDGGEPIEATNIHRDGV